MVHTITCILDRNISNKFTMARVITADDVNNKVTAEINICIAGNPKVGKTAITRAFAHSIFSEEYIPTVGTDFDTRLFEADTNIVKVHLHDISGQESFLWSAKESIRNADAFIFCYDITDQKTFEGIPRWLTLLNSHAKHPGLPKLLVGNKLDLRHKQTVAAVEAKEYGIPNGMVQIEMSTKSGQNLNASFYIVVNNVLRFRKLGTAIPVGTVNRLYERITTHVHEKPSSVVKSMENGDNYVNVFRVLLLGSVRTGKTALRTRFCRDKFSRDYFASAGLDYSTRTLVVDGDKVQVQVWDMSGDGAYDTLRKSYYKGANGFLILYDIADQKTFENAQLLVKDLDMYERSDCPKIVVGNKCDLVSKKAVGDDIVQEWADGWKVPAMDVSAKNGCNVDAAFFKLVCALKRHLAPWKKVYDFS